MPNPLKRLTGPAYFILCLLFVYPLVDWATNVWPMSPSAFQWRYGSIALLSGFLLTPMIGLLLLEGLAVAAGHFRVARAGAVVAAILGVALLLACALFGLDAMQVRATVPAASMGAFQMGAGRALFKNALMGVGFLWLGWAGWRVAGDAAAAAAARRPAGVLTRP